MIASMQHLNVPQVLGFEGGRILLSEIPGRDMYDADLPAMLAMVKLLVEIQTDWQSRIDELIALGLPDWREQRLTDLIEDVFVRTQLQLDARDCTSLEKFLDELPRRFAELDACGIEDSLVHGDFHPGNVRELDGTLTLLDWGDAGIGHPMLDQPAFIERVPQDARQAIIDYWSQQWLLCRPRSDPKRASALIGPIAAARQAAIYRGFLDNIEPSERSYHEADPAVWLNRTADLLRQE
ncbi:MAG: aminoglycoside phosphotransferase family protein [Cucumibacter sp.]